MHINTIDRSYYFLAFLSFIIAFYTIVIHIGFTILPVLFTLFGFFSYYFLKEKSVLIFFALVPAINSLPAFFFNGYSYNLMGTLLFYLSGMVISSLLRDGKEKSFTDFRWGKIYLIFLGILWLSALFLLLKWSNITVGTDAFLKDTPVSPGSPLPPRNSFASIFPVITLFLYSVAPFTVLLIRRSGLGKAKIFRALATGYCLSFAIALFQKYVDPEFMAIRWWSKKLGQFNGGFSDFNGFGFFSGVIFLYSFILVTASFTQKKIELSGFLKRNIFNILILTVSLFGIFFSGSRTAFLFLLFALFLFFINGRFRLRVKLITVLLLILIILLTGSVLEKRLKTTLSKFDELYKGRSVFKTLDGVTNGRVQMIADSGKILSRFFASGVGTGNFLFYRKYMKYGEKYLEDLPLNQYLLIADETGITGLSLFLLFFYLLIGRGTLKNPEGKVLLAIMVVLLAGNSFWLPEVLVLFWMIVGFFGPGEKLSKTWNRNSNIFAAIVITIFLAGNITSFNKLHPVRLMSEKSLSYDYGFWDESNVSDFRWSKSVSGLYLKLNKDGSSEKLKISCGAPVNKLKTKSQRVRLYWRGKFFAEKIFRVNEDFKFEIKGKPFQSGILKIEVSPTFNLKKMNLGQESRDLGVMLYYPGFRYFSSD